MEGFSGGGPAAGDAEGDVFTLQNLTYPSKTYKSFDLGNHNLRTEPNWSFRGGVNPFEDKDHPHSAMLSDDSEDYEPDPVTVSEFYSKLRRPVSKLRDKKGNWEFHFEVVQSAKTGMHGIRLLKVIVKPKCHKHASKKAEQLQNELRKELEELKKNIPPQWKNDMDHL